MDKHTVLTRIREVGLVPIVRAQSAEEAATALDAILAGGVPVLEVSMTVPGTLALIETLSRRYGDEVVLGAGTVLDAETARAVILAGARFVVSPSLNLDTVACCHRYGVAVFPGALTPTEVLGAWQAGADMVKVFPVNSVGGASYIKALKAPLPQVELLPTSGVSLETVDDFIRAGSAALGVGGGLVDLAAVRAGRAAEITERARQYREAVRRARQG